MWYSLLAYFLTFRTNEVTWLLPLTVSMMDVKLFWESLWNLSFVVWLKMNWCCTNYWWNPPKFFPWSFNIVMGFDYNAEKVSATVFVWHVTMLQHYTVDRGFWYLSYYFLNSTPLLQHYNIISNDLLNVFKCKDLTIIFFVFFLSDSLTSK